MDLTSILVFGSSCPRFIERRNSTQKKLLSSGISYVVVGPAGICMGQYITIGRLSGAAIHTFFSFVVHTHKKSGWGCLFIQRGFRGNRLPACFATSSIFSATTG